MVTTTPHSGAANAPLPGASGAPGVGHSTGVAVQWLAPLGVFRFSFAIPLNAYKGDLRTYPDEVERFQFSVGQAF